MGACWGSGTFVHSDWRQGIYEIQKSAEEYYGDQDGYSGAENSCSFSYLKDLSNKSEKELKKLMEDYMDKLDSGDGYVCNLGVDSYALYATKIISDVTAPFDTRAILKNMYKGPCMLIRLDNMGNVHMVDEGTLVDLKYKVHIKLRRSNYLEEYYILSKKKSYYCTYEKKVQKSTKRKTDENILVVPLKKYIYFGWFKE